MPRCNCFQGLEGSLEGGLEGPILTGLHGGTFRAFQSRASTSTCLDSSTVLLCLGQLRTGRRANLASGGPLRGRGHSQAGILGLM